MTNRTKKAEMNIITSLIAQITTMVCGFIIPQLLIRTFGSEIYGATTSIANFLAYISLIEGGVAGVARAALYQPLVKEDNNTISKVYLEVNNFFKTIGIIFLIYTIILASTYNMIAKDSSFNWDFTFFLVLVISISTVGQYFLGISNSVLLQADQKLYIINILSIITVIINALFTIILTIINCKIITVKLVSSLIFLIRPIFLAIYVKRNYYLEKNVSVSKDAPSAIGQKWTALGQHIAYFLHLNTDIAVLTVLSNLKTVAVYSVYSMIVTSIRNLTSSFNNGLESVLGELYARKENDKLHRVFGYYETLISIVATSMFSCTAVLIIPFVKLYTAGIKDVNYIIPQFGFILLIAELTFTLRIPYHHMINASGRFKQTKMAAYGEAGLNIVLSILLVFKYQIVGVAIATFIATLYRGIYYAVYLSKHIMHRKLLLYLKRMMINYSLFLLISLIGYELMKKTVLSNYIQWAFYGIIILVISTLISILANLVFYLEDIREIVKRVIGIISR